MMRLFGKKPKEAGPTVPAGLTARCWYYNKRATGMLEADTFVLRETTLPELGSGDVLIRTIYLSLDATNRVWLSDWDIYMEPVRVGDPMRGFVLGEVVASANTAFTPGMLVAGTHTWADYFVTDGEGFVPFPKIEGVPLADAFGTLMIAAPTAHYGLLGIGKPKAGDTVVVTAAAGAVGAFVGQIAKIKGCRVVGVAGAEDKCRWLVDELGFDAVVNYKTETVLDGLRRTCPNGIDVHFENVGGEVLDAGLTLMNDYGRVVICGLISTYNESGPTPGPYMFRNLIMRRLKVEGFVILDHLDKYPKMYEDLVPWMLAGKLKYKLHVVDGLEQAADALKLLYTGGNSGKLMVRIGEDP